MEIKIEDLEEGDEILIACQSHMKYLRIVRKPALGKSLHWKTQQPLYKAVKVSSNQTVNVVNYIGWNSVPYTRTEKKWLLIPENHNIEFFQNLSDKTIWLIKHKNE